MRRTAIVGGHGKIARHLVALLASEGDTPVAIVRKEAHAEELTTLGAEVRLLDIELSGAEQLGLAFMGCDAVVFAAGAGADGDVNRKRTVDFEGSLKSVIGADLAGIRRFVQVSAIGVDRPVADDATPVWRAYVRAKSEADAELRQSRLDWTILRPGALTDEPPTGHITLGETVERGAISRSDVAALIAVCLDDDRTIGRQWEVVGGSTPVADAISSLV